MSTNYTDHLGLTLWEANDPVLRTEFNANHQKLDTAISALTTAMATAHGCVTGTYEGGANSTHVVINAGFKPSLGIILAPHTDSTNSSDVVCLLAIGNATMRIKRSSSNTITAESAFTDTGLNLKEGDSSKYGLNYAGQTYYYALFH